MCVSSPHVFPHCFLLGGVPPAEFRQVPTEHVTSWRSAPLVGSPRSPSVCADWSRHPGRPRQTDVWRPCRVLPRLAWPRPMWPSCFVSFILSQCLFPSCFNLREKRQSLRSTRVCVQAYDQASVEATCLPRARWAGPELGGLGKGASGCGHDSGRGIQASVETTGGTRVSRRQWKAGVLGVHTQGCSGRLALWPGR